jgi:hypothetical protein
LTKEKMRRKWLEGFSMKIKLKSENDKPHLDT